MDLEQFKAKAASIKRLLDDELVSIHQQAGDLTPDAVARKRQAARQAYDKAMADLKKEAKGQLDAEVQALHDKAKKAKQGRFAGLRQTVGDVVAFEIVKEQLRQKDAEGIVKAYQDSVDEGEKAIIGVFGLGIMRDKGANPEIRQRLERLLADSDKAAILEKQAEELGKLERDISKLDPLAVKEDIVRRLGIN